MLNPDYKEILSILRNNDVEFLLVGAYALAVHGFPRATADIDIFVKPDNDNAEKLYRALQIFGAPLKDISPADFVSPGIVLQIGVAPRRIDILTSIDGLTFDEAVIGMETIQIEDLSIPVISRKNLISNKLATGREKDKLDAENLMKQ
ncbi:MAG: hypothetical protein GXO70_10980 [Acidobacteria bacterium]|nr:hypothetical protein [Acidobacteriota bacterium]